MPQERLYNGEQLSEILGVSETYYYQLRKAKVIAYARDAQGHEIKGRYSLEAVKQFVAWLMAKGKEKPSSQAEYDKARTEKMQAERDWYVMRNQLLRRKLVYWDDVELEIGNMLIALRNKLLGFPTYVGRMLEEKSYPEIMRILTQAIYELLEALRNPTVDQVTANRPRREQAYLEEKIEERSEAPPTHTNGKEEIEDLDN